MFGKLHTAYIDIYGIRFISGALRQTTTTCRHSRTKTVDHGVIAVRCCCDCGACTDEPLDGLVLCLLRDRFAYNWDELNAISVG